MTNTQKSSTAKVVIPEIRTKNTVTKNVIETEHPVYKTKILVVSGNEPEFDYAGYAKSKISEITKILPVNIPRSLVAMLFAIVVIPIIMSPGIFMPDFTIAGGDAALSQYKFPESIFRNLNFDNREILKAQLDTLVASYEKKLVHLNPEWDFAKLLQSRVKIAKAIWENATDDLFLDYMMAQISDIKTKPYFSYSNPCFTHDDKKINTHFNSLGKWARDTDQTDFERQVAEFMAKYPDIFAKANADRLENINALIGQAVIENAYVISEIKVTEVKKVKKAKKHHKRRYKKAASKAAAAPVEKKKDEAVSAAPAPAPEAPAAPAPDMTPAPAPVPVEEPKKEEKKDVKKDAKKDKKAAAPAPAPAPAAEAAPAPAPDASMPAPDMTPMPAPDAPAADATPAPAPAPAKDAKKPAKAK